MLVLTAFVSVLLLASEAETSPMRICTSRFIALRECRSRPYDDTEIETELRIIDDRGSRIYNTIPCTETYVVIRGILYSIYISTLIFVHYLLFLHV